jgi:hypothetical protein
MKAKQIKYSKLIKELDDDSLASDANNLVLPYTWDARNIRNIVNILYELLTESQDINYLLKRYHCVITHQNSVSEITDV